MSAKHDRKKVRAAIAGMDELKVTPTEILRRLRNDEAGIGYAVDIKQRTVYYHLTNIRQERAREETQQDTLTATVGAGKQAAVNLLLRELNKLQQIPVGKMKTTQVPVVERIHLALTRMERSERGPGRSVPAAGDGGAIRQLTALELLAQQEQAGDDGDQPPAQPDIHPS